MGQQSIIGAVTMKYLVVFALALAAASAIHIPKKYAHYKPGYMRIPGWEKIASGERKLNQKEPTMTFTPREDFLPRADCGVPGFKLEDHERIVVSVTSRRSSATLPWTSSRRCPPPPPPPPWRSPTSCPTARSSPSATRGSGAPRPSSSPASWEWRPAASTRPPTTPS